MMLSMRYLAMYCISIAAVSVTGYAQTLDDSKLMGDVGIANYRNPAITRSNQKNNVALPYVYADYGN